MSCLDLRCEKLAVEAHKKGQELGFCHSGPLKMEGFGEQPKHPDPKACHALYDEAGKKCDALPQPPSPDDIKYLSGWENALKGYELVMIDGKPACLFFEW